MGVVHSQAPDELLCTQGLVFRVVREQFLFIFVTVLHSFCRVLAVIVVTQCLRIHFPAGSGKT